MAAAENFATDPSHFAEELEQAKNEAIYYLAYGLSHELNNPLANIQARAGVLLSQCDNLDQRQMLEAIIDNASRGCEMLGDLMLVARPPQLQLSEFDLGQLGAHIRQRGCKWSELNGIRFFQDWKPSCIARLDRSMLCEVVWALLRNSIEASTRGRSIRLSASLGDRQLHIQIDDEGPGMSSAALRHCFDPFFSGREAGRGLGLGLTKAKKLSQIHGGDLRIANLATGGCRASLWIAIEPGHSEPSGKS